MRTLVLELEAPYNSSWLDGWKQTMRETARDMMEENPQFAHTLSDTDPVPPNADAWNWDAPGPPRTPLLTDFPTHNPNLRATRTLAEVLRGINDRLPKYVPHIPVNGDPIRTKYYETDDEDQSYDIIVQEEMCGAGFWDALIPVLVPPTRRSRSATDGNGLLIFDGAQSESSSEASSSDRQVVDE